MKKLFFALIPVIVLLSCKSNIKNKPADTLTAVKPARVSPVKKLLPIYQGVWVKSDYIEKIKQTHSVLAAVDLVTGITGMQIDSSLLNGDSLEATVGWDNQNPGSVALTFKPGKNPAAVKFGEDELGYSITNGDTSLILYQVYQNQLFKTLYHKILNVSADRNVSDGINYAINKALIAGGYLLTFGPKKVSEVTFTADGQVTGLEGFKKYFVENDLKPGPLKNLDLIIFDEFSSKRATYSYLFKGNTLELYETKPNEKATRMVLGKLKYILTRQ
ncbi:hypothetical protein IDJ77_20870 [Mucilaginibacter sp. ZT4R22]|uniref:Uncharacterized protein n=1 Tax=Mucilaginibacter pankratovii TaxID=2772110 RepID=A0ABR7WVF7_9SPHI|nr:hypothetical protein [Mucilaginibacter pankratovii]MBD1366278.1 hypothetical protein [Mucilaginibacter pankratovii]